jgi:phenylalanyl-tRNA synthetase alpha chain
MSGPNTDYDPVEVTPLKADEVEAMRDAALSAIDSAATLEELKRVRTEHAGDRSPLALANREIGALPPQARKEAGQRIGQARGAVSKALAARQVVLEEEHEARILVDEAVDVTLPWDRNPVGARHPLTTLSERIADVFVAMGWEIAEGPVVEAEWLNFDALNLGRDHPARTMQDTFWMEPPENAIVLRTHTSPVQARTMLTRKPPIYIVCPGRVFRTDEYDATHSPVFHQVEGLVVDEGITMAHLKGTLDHFAAAMFGEGISTRFRPSYFPFTEPSAEVDLVCFVCRGTGKAPDEEAGSTAAEPTGAASVDCRTCRGEGWIEWGGCGVVNPRVLVACGVDPERYTGFAFGMGIDRTLMFRHGVEDLRDLFEGDVRFTTAFGTDL